jgi:hypothetical protein
MVTVSSEAGAVNVVAVPLAVCAGLKFDALQAAAPVVEHDQFTPAFAESFETVAVYWPVAPV